MEGGEQKFTHSAAQLVTAARHLHLLGRERWGGWFIVQDVEDHLVKGTM